MARHQGPGPGAMLWARVPGTGDEEEEHRGCDGAEPEDIRGAPGGSEDKVEEPRGGCNCGVPEDVEERGAPDEDERVEADGGSADCMQVNSEFIFSDRFCTST